jgi:hypothetical protein
VAILALLLVTTAIICHRLIRPFWLAVGLAGPLASFLYQVLGYIELGYLDPFFMIAFATVTVYAWFGAALVGGAMHALDLRPKAKPTGEDA